MIFKDAAEKKLWRLKIKVDKIDQLNNYFSIICCKAIIISIKS